MSVSEDRISHLAHIIMDTLWRDDLADFPDEPRALACVKRSLENFFSVFDQIDDLVRIKLRTKAPGSREYEILYQKYFQEELVKRKW